MSISPSFKYLTPRVADQIRGLRVSSRHPMQGTVQGMHRSPDMGASVEFAEYRNYIPGDSPNLIDWAVYAKTDRYMIRRFQDETNLKVTLLIDHSASLDFKKLGQISKFEYACSLAAGLMYLFACQGDLVSLVLFSGKVTQRFAPVSNVETLSPILLEMEKIKPIGQGDIAKSLHEAANFLTQRGKVIVISDFLQNPEQLSRGIQHLQHQRHDVTVFHVLDGAEITLPYKGLVEMRDLETGGLLLIDSDAIRPRYTEAVNLYLSQVQSICNRSGSAYLTIDTRASLLDAISKVVRS